MPEENMNEEFRLKKTDEERNYLIEKINRSEFELEKFELYRTLTYFNF